MYTYVSLDYLAGLVAGDGNITGSRRVRVFDYSREFLERICGDLRKHLGLSCSVYWEGSVWCLSVYSEQLVKELKERMINPHDRLEWLKGFVDAEGSIYIWVRKKNRIYYQVSITNTKTQYVNIATIELQKHSINYRVVIYRDKWNPRYKILITQKDSIKRFLETIGFRHPLKAHRAIEALSHLSR